MFAGASTTSMPKNRSSENVFPNMRVYTPEQEAANDKWQARIAQESVQRKDQRSSLIPRAMAGDPEAQGILRAAGAGVSSTNAKSANAWAAGSLSSATMSTFGLKA